MRTLRLIALASLVAGSLHAQYFQHVYGSQRREYLESGVNAVAPLGQGHIMTGYTTLPGINSPMVTSTDKDGNIGNFNNWYRVFDPNTGVVMDAKGRRIIQPAAENGNSLVWGDYTDHQGAPSDRFFFAVVNPAGVMAPMLGYALPFQVTEAEATSMYYSTTQPNTVFVCGWVRVQPGAPRYPVVASINSITCAINWSYIYRDPNGNDVAPMDLVESPFPSQNPIGVPDIALTGHMTRPGFVESGFLWFIPTTGIPGVTLYEIGNPNSGFPCGLDAIDIAWNADPNTGQPGFAMGGYSYNQNNGTDDMWAIKVDWLGTTTHFTTLVDYWMGQRKEYAYDIIERKNMAGNFEYYLGGYVDNGVFGGEDAVVNKLDANGVPFPGLPQFTYGGSRDERAFQLDQYNNYGWNNDGLSVYAETYGGSWTFLGGPDFYLVKAYFNGVQNPWCRYDLQNPHWYDGPKPVEKWNPRDIDKLKKVALRAIESPMQDREICWWPDDAGSGGDNSRLAAETANTLEQPGYFPNPVSRENGLVTVTFGKEVVAGVAQVELRNSLGQLVWTKQISLADGQTNMQIELGDKLNSGMYHLSVRQSGVLNNYRILVE